MTFYSDHAAEEAVTGAFFKASSGKLFAACKICRAAYTVGLIKVCFRQCLLACLPGQALCLLLLVVLLYIVVECKRV